MKRRRTCHEDYTVGWVCALPIELAAAKKMLDEEHDDLDYDANDNNLYTLGRIGEHNVVIACLPKGQMGTISAAAVAIQMKSTFMAIRFGLMVGIGGGVPSANADIRLGDVVVSKPDKVHGGVVQYDFGKATQSGFERTGTLNAPPTILLNAVTKLESCYLNERNRFSEYVSKLNDQPPFTRQDAGPDVLFDADYNHVGGSTCEQCSKERVVKRKPRSQEIHYGTIASGNLVIKDAAYRDTLSSDLGGVLCFEMEAAGLMNYFPCLVIRGICDYADSHKNKRWQAFAAGAAAIYAKEVLSVIPAAEVKTTSTTKFDMEIVKEILQPIPDNLDLEEFLNMLCKIDQENHRSTISTLDCDKPEFYWIFRNEDFRQWDCANCSHILWLSGPYHCNIHRASSFIVKQALEKQQFVLYFFCSTARSFDSFVRPFIHTILYQIVCSSSLSKKTSIVKTFLHALVEAIIQREKLPTVKSGDSLKTNAKKILHFSTDVLWTALSKVLSCNPNEKLLIVVDGLEHVAHQRDNFIKGLRSFIELLHQQMSKIKVLITSGRQADTKEVFSDFHCIDYDNERQECLFSLRFNNERFAKISEQFEGSYEWLWSHSQYKKWSTSKRSTILLIEGKPGSGKSTLTKYFYYNLREREPAAESAIVAKFFYSYREGERQRSHYNMLLCILHDILEQDKAFFYHRFQTEYRDFLRHGHNVRWEYRSLKTVLKSLKDYPPANKIYLIIDAIDESEDHDRSEILKLLLNLCNEMSNCIVKIFVASRPVRQIELRKDEFKNSIRLQDETKADISGYVHSLLDCLNPQVLADVTEFMVEKAQGVFLWVKLVAKGLLNLVEGGDSEAEISHFLQRQETELEGLYKLMFQKLINNRQHLPGTLKMFQFVLSACRSLTVDELLHALAVPDDLDTKFTPLGNSFHKQIPARQYIIHHGGDFLEIKPHHGTCATRSYSGNLQKNKTSCNETVQVMHQTVREFFLNPNGCVTNSEFNLCEKTAHMRISITCIRYLMLFVHNFFVDRPQQYVEKWTLEDIECYVQYLDKWPLASYALRYLRYHLDRCDGDTYVPGIVSQLIDELAHNAALYLLQGWVQSQLNKIPLCSEDCDAAQDFRNEILHAAVRKGLFVAAEVSIIVGANVDEMDKDGRTPLLWAAEQGYEAIVKLLLETGKVEVDSGDYYDGRTPLWCAVERGHEMIVKQLIETGKVNVDSGNNYYGGRTPLSWAAERGHDVIVKLLLETGKVDIDSKDPYYGRTPLSWAAEKGHKEVVKLLLEMDKVDLDPRNNYYRRTPLSWAAGSGHEAVVKLLLDTGNVDMDSKDSNYGRTPLSWAAVNGHDAVVKLLLGTGKVDMDSKDSKYGRTPLSWAAASGHKAVVKLLLETSKVEVDSKDYYGGRTPLWWAAVSGHDAIVKLLLETGMVDVDRKDSHYGRTPLSWAAMKGHDAVVKLLLKTGRVDVNSKDSNYGRTPLWWASARGHDSVVKLLLLDTGCVDVNSKDNYDNRTPLWCAAERGHNVVVKLLLERDEVDANSKDSNYGRTLLSWAAVNGRVMVVKLLLEIGKVVVDSKDYYGRTPLWWAAVSGHDEVVKLLQSSLAMQLVTE